MRRLFLLRPEPGATASLERAKALGLDAVSVPLFRIEPLAWESPEAANFDAVLLTSANAVLHGGEGLTAYRGLKAYAVGKATAEAARDAGFHIAGTGDSGVERLLGSIGADLRLLHLAGEDRRGTERARQKITLVTVYRAVELPEPVGLAAIEGQVAALHSPRAAERLARLALKRENIRLACISEAAAAAAGDGWEAKQAPATPNDEALLALAARLCEKPGEE